MKKKYSYLYSDTNIGIILTLAVIILYLLRFSLFEICEYKLYDLRAKLRQSSEPVRKIVLVGIDDKSLKVIGQWPWSRNIIADLILKINFTQPKVIGIDMLLSAPAGNIELSAIQRIKEKYSSLLKQRLMDVKALKLKKPIEKSVQNLVINTCDPLLQELNSSVSSLNEDMNLSLAISSASNIILPVSFSVGHPVTDNVPEIPLMLSDSLIMSGTKKICPTIIEAYEPIMPLEIFGFNAKGFGYNNLFPDSDGVVRRSILLLRNRDKYFPSFALRIAGFAVGNNVDKITISPGNWIGLGNRTEIITDKNSAVLLDYSKKGTSFPYYSASDVLSDKISPLAFYNKIVLLGITSKNIAGLYNSPVAADISSIEITANVIHNLLYQKILVRPTWANIWELEVLLVLGIFITILFPQLKLFSRTILTLVMIFIVLVAGFYFFIQYGYWFKLIYVLFLLVAGYVVITLKQLFIVKITGHTTVIPKREKKKHVNFMSESNLSQSIPRPEASKEICYLAEKAQFSDQKIVIGKYEIINELGTSKICPTYLGKEIGSDKKVVIKKLNLENCTSEDIDQNVKEHFTEGMRAVARLEHQGIIKVYDVVEEQNLTYAVMEYVEGNTLSMFCGKDTILSIEQVFSIVVKIAEVLEYAYNNGIMHHNLNPENIILLDNGEIKISGFGISRIILSSQLRQELLLNYMAPEQIAGESVDHRADIYSLGIIFFEMLTGEKPFKDNDPVQLSYKIVNEHYPDPKQINGKIPSCAKVIIDRALGKKAENRYYHINELAGDIKVCLTGRKREKQISYITKDNL